MKKIFKPVTKKQSSEFGQVVVLFVIFAIFYGKNYHLAYVAFWLQLANILIPHILYPFAMIWFGLSVILARVSSFIILNLIFWLLVCPVGMIRKILGKDSLKTGKFKKERISVMTERNHLYEKDDLLYTF